MRFISADQIFDGFHYLPAGTVLVLSPQNMLMDILPPDSIEKNRIQIFDGTLCPGFLNVHCHLELSYLKGQIAQRTGLSAFAQQLMTLRGKMPLEERMEWMQEADREMSRNGIVAVGDISNSSESLPVKMQSKLQYHTFVELIGLNPANAEAIFTKGKDLLSIFSRDGLSASLTPHAPYSVSAELAKAISNHTASEKSPLSIHNQEALAETDFFMDKGGSINDLYKFLGLDISFFNPPAKSSLAVFASLLDSRPRMFVHNTFTTAADVALAEDPHTYWCFCPKANRYIEDALPDYSIFPEESICFGTDSLASNTQLDLCSEITEMRNAACTFSDTAILRGLTSNAARALGLQEKMGSLRKNQNAGINLLKINKDEYRCIAKIA